MGDILHALPAMTALRIAHFDWVIDWVVEPRWRALLTADEPCALKGHDLSRAVNTAKQVWDMQVAEKLNSVKGTGFGSYINPAKSTRALAPEGYIAPISPERSRFSAATNAAPIQCAPSPTQAQTTQPLIDHLHLAATKQWRKAPFSSETRDEFRALRAALQIGEYDAVIDLQGAIRSALLARLAARLAGCRRVIGEANPRELPARWLFTERVPTHGAHVIEQDLELASAIAGDALAPVAPWLPVDPAAEAWAYQILPPGGEAPVVLINPGAGWGAKLWPIERYAAVAQALVARGYRVLVNAGPGEELLAEVIASQTGGAATPLNCTLAQLIAVTRRIALCIAGDTGPLHLACALGRPVVGIYGPTDPSRNGPFGTRFTVLRSPHSRLDHSRRAAPESGLLTIQPEEVLRAAEALLYS
jgi:heptosyltransferase-1